MAFIERRNYKALEWNHHYNTYYERNWKHETKCYLNALCKCNTKKHLQHRCKCHANWNWYLHQIHDPKTNIPPLTGHTSTDIGNAFITIGGRRKSDVIEVYQVSKDFAHCKKLQTQGQVPSGRFAHTSNYIPPLNAILMFGGFDSKMNYNDARLLRLEDLTWYNLASNTNIDYRAYHCSATRIIYDHNSQQNIFQCYIFGGQFCDGGPYVYHNTLFMFQFHSNGYFNITEMQPNTLSDTLAPRSQSYAFIKDNYLYVYGGCDARTTFNDLWQFDLNIHVWNKILCKGPILAPLTHGIEAKNFRVHAARKACYFDRQLDQMIVIHHGELSDIQKQYVQYSDTVYEFEQRIARQTRMQVEKWSPALSAFDMYCASRPCSSKSSVSPAAPHKRRRSLSTIGILHQTRAARCHVFAFSLREKRWDIIKCNQIKHNLPPFIKHTCFVRVGMCLVMMGGGEGKKVLNYMSKLYMLKIPRHRIMSTVSWSRERLLWIGHYKRDKQCMLYRCPKHIICHIVDFLNTKIMQSDRNYDMLHLQEMDSVSSPEPQLIPNIVLIESATTTGNDIENIKPQNNVTTLMGLADCSNVQTELMANHSAETLMGFTDSTKN
eukprot:196574_1